MDAKLDALAELLVQLLVVVLSLGNFGEHLAALLHKVLLDDVEDLVLLKGLTGDVERILVIDLICLPAKLSCCFGAMPSSS